MFLTTLYNKRDCSNQLVQLLLQPSRRSSLQRLHHHHYHSSLLWVAATNIVYSPCNAADCCQRTRSQLWRRFCATSTGVTWTPCRRRVLLTGTGPSSVLTTLTALITSSVCGSETWRWSHATITRCGTAASGLARSRRPAWPSATDCCGASSIAPSTTRSRRGSASTDIANVPMIFAARYLTRFLIAYTCCRPKG